MSVCVRPSGPSTNPSLLRAFSRWLRGGTVARGLAALLIPGIGAACSSSSASGPNLVAKPAAPEAPATLELPLEIASAPRARQVIARGLHNPRGVHPGLGGLLVAEAGSGTAEDGRLLLLQDRSGDGLFLAADERQVLLDKQPSKQLIKIVRRDEVFGLAAIEEGDGEILVSLAFFGGPSTFLKASAGAVTTWGSTHGNINDLTYDPKRKRWFGASSTSDEVVRLNPGGGSERVVKIPPLPNGQDAVPANIEDDPLSGDLLVTLFTGSPEGEEGGEGIEIRPRAGGIVAVNPDTKAFRWLVRGLTVPTDLAVTADGTIYVLEFCDKFLDPAETVDALLKRPSHGGFRRFSGRLLRLDRRTGAASVVASGLDAPTNLALIGDQLYISEGMGTPGREIPGPAGTVKLDGFIERIAATP